MESESYRLPKYRLHRPSGRGVIQYAPLFGKNPHYLPGAFNSDESRRAYEAACKQVLAHKLGLEAAVRPTRHSTVGEMLNQYLSWGASHYGPANREFKQLRLVVRLINTHHGKTKLSEFGPLALKEIRAAMLKIKSRERRLSRSYINHQVHRVRRVFRWGVENEWYPADKMLALDAVAALQPGKTPAPDLPDVQPVAWDAVSAVLPFVQPVIAAMIQVQHFTGMRSDELTSMRPEFIDRSGDVWVYQPPEHKTAWRGKLKIIPIGPLAQKFLRPYLDAAQGYIFSPRIAVEQQAAKRRANRKTKAYGPAKARKTRRVRERYDGHSYYGAIKHGFARAEAADMKITRWHPHQLRHTRATTTRASYGMEGAQAQLGNTFTATALYAERSLALAMRIARETG